MVLMVKLLLTQLGHLCVYVDDQAMNDVLSIKHPPSSKSPICLVAMVCRLCVCDFVAARHPAREITQSQPTHTFPLNQSSQTP